MTTKWVYLFNELDQAENHMGNDWDKVRGLLGGKGANLAEMERIGVPVPPGFTVTTEACNAYLAAKSVFPMEYGVKSPFDLFHEVFSNKRSNGDLTPYLKTRACVDRKFNPKK